MPPSSLVMTSRTGVSTMRMSRAAKRARVSSSSSVPWVK
jgi:hypothetical protein